MVSKQEQEDRSFYKSFIVSIILYFLSIRLVSLFHFKLKPITLSCCSTSSYLFLFLYIFFVTEFSIFNILKDFKLFMVEERLACVLCSVL